MPLAIRVIDSITELVAPGFSSGQHPRWNGTAFAAADVYTEAEVDGLLASYATVAALTSHTSDTANPHSVTASQAGAEPALGNPGSNGQVLSSTTGGTRSWVDPGAADISDLAASGFSTNDYARWNGSQFQPDEAVARKNATGDWTAVQAFINGTSVDFYSGASGNAYGPRIYAGGANDLRLSAFSSVTLETSAGSLTMKPASQWTVASGFGMAASGGTGWRVFTTGGDRYTLSFFNDARLSNTGGDRWRLYRTGELRFGGKSSTGTDRDIVEIGRDWIVNTDASRTGRGYLRAYDYNGTREAVRWAANGSAALLGFYGATAVAKQTVSGSRGGNAALQSLLTALATLGLITDSTT